MFTQRGLTRRVDELGRVVIPVEWRREFGLVPGARVEIYATDEGVFIKPKVGPADERERGE